MLERLGGILQDARLVVKAAKSRILIIYKGQVRRKELKMNGEVITSLSDKPVKYLGKWYLGSGTIQSEGDTADRGGG